MRPANEVSGVEAPVRQAGTLNAIGLAERLVSQADGRAKRLEPAARKLKDLELWPRKKGTPAELDFAPAGAATVEHKGRNAIQ